jgi:sugar phosphate isomerase/epimerase
MGPRELGTSANPMQHQLLALQTKIREGASSIEFQFGGRGKGNSQASTPESYGSDDREAMRTLAEYNDVRTSTHATYTVSGLAGFGQNGFDKQAQHQVMEEVKRAVDFASQASTGGAIVVHSGEWQRPISEQRWAREDFQRYFGSDADPNIRGYAEESKRATLPVVDARTGAIIGGIRKDQEIFEPKWITASEFEKKTGKKLAYQDLKGNKVDRYDPNDYVDYDGRKINAENTEELFRRVPEWNKEGTNFATQKLDWNELVNRTKRWNEQHRGQRGFVELTPEQMYAQIELDNQILQSKGSSLFYAQNYEQDKKRYEKYKQALELANTVGKNLPKDQLWKLLRTEGRSEIIGDFMPPETKDVRDWLKEQIDSTERHMRHIHEASSAADVQARTLQERKANIKTMEEYGLQETGQALAQLGVYAMEKSKQMYENVRKQGGDVHKYNKLYIAPENVFPAEYGSHPDELIKIVEAGRSQMAKELLDKNIARSQQEAQKLAAEHIKSTIDIGHLNMWKTHMKRIPGESEDAFNKRFEQWTMDKLEVMHKKGILGHFHLTDNLGFNDEHLTPGQGNAPIRSFVKKLESLGYKDFIIEPGSFNGTTAMGETWSYLGLQGFSGTHGHFAPGGRFTDIHWRHAGGYAPPNYVVGQYVPSNEWTLWSGTPLE